MNTNESQESHVEPQASGMEKSTDLTTDPQIKSDYISLHGSNQNSNNKISNFSSAFTKIKNSELYKEAPVNTKASENKDVASKVPSLNSVIVNPRQRGNPILKFIRNVPWEFSEIVPDYVMGNTTCAMFLSLRYFNLNPNYIHDRLKALGKQYELRVLLVQVDIKDPHLELKQITKICVFADLTLMLAWSPEEAGRIIEIYKVFENKPPDLIMEKQDSNPYTQLIEALTSIKSINRTDAMTLLSNFGSLEKIVSTTPEELALCPGFGPQKASKLHTVLHQAFKK
ncbi:UNVERIFIED_CONTAM: hypothetical protein GTU68_057756 [Idotea baltica]|nr:hypothetical protein [Idotea baltica]